MKEKFSTLNILLALMMLNGMLGMSCKKEKDVEVHERPIVAGGPSGASGSCGDSTITGAIT
ncbi:hypothetical protein SAMN04488128_102764 [Chitinophaga eiseniae]|uniref:Uncharacterized protein n=1 Tax=Chitinophaga eiseniae TaxID=634771 RepID=A0A1T4R2D9_9BACT|nr:hypothetical protein [Chitinophaga eiseniae]SKA10123.1 hypothetical protein SAMN04488128_102764 [Chitinophaga eiseniae]